MIETVSERDLTKELDNFRKELEEKVGNKEISIEEAVANYIEKKDDIDAQIELLRREDKNYLKRSFNTAIAGFKKIEKGYADKARLDIQNLTLQEMILENAKDLRRAKDGLGAFLADEKTMYRSMIRMLIVLAQQNQIIIQKLYEE